MMQLSTFSSYFLSYIQIQLGMLQQTRLQWTVFGNNIQEATMKTDATTNAQDYNWLM